MRTAKAISASNSTGRLGLPGKFYIDNAQLTLIDSSALSLTAQSTLKSAAVSAEQQALNAAAASNQDPNWSIAGTPLDQ
jgi:hypothetical protein